MNFWALMIYRHILMRTHFDLFKGLKLGLQDSSLENYYFNSSSLGPKRSIRPRAPKPPGLHRVCPVARCQRPTLGALPANACHEIAAAIQMRGNSWISTVWLWLYLVSRAQSTLVQQMGEQGGPGTGTHHTPGHQERHRNEFAWILSFSPVRDLFNPSKLLQDWGWATWELTGQH